MKGKGVTSVQVLTTRFFLEQAYKWLGTVLEQKHDLLWGKDNLFLV